MHSLRRILQHGGKEGDFNSQERAQLAYRKNLLYVHSLRELTVNAVLPGIHAYAQISVHSRSRLGWLLSPLMRRRF